MFGVRAGLQHSRWVSLFRFQYILIPTDSNGIFNKEKAWKEFYTYFNPTSFDRWGDWGQQRLNVWPMGQEMQRRIVYPGSPRMKRPWVSKDEIIKFSGPLWSNGGLAGHNNRFYRFPGRGIFLPHWSYRNTIFIQAERTITLKVSQLLEEIWSEKQSRNFFSIVGLYKWDCCASRIKCYFLFSSFFNPTNPTVITSSIGW